MTKDEALRLALEALETLHDENMDYLTRNKLGGENNQCMVFAREAITAIKAALEAKDEPVATDWERIARVQNAKLMAVCDGAGGFEKLCEVMDKYKAITPTQRTWVGLTAHERMMCRSYDVDEAIANTENKLKEKNT